MCGPAMAPKATGRRSISSIRRATRWSSRDPRMASRRPTDAGLVAQDHRAAYEALPDQLAQDEIGHIGARDRRKAAQPQALAGAVADAPWRIGQQHRIHDGPVERAAL